MKQIDDITWQSNDGLITFKNMDCNEFMAGCKDNEFDLNLSDPPYGWGAKLKGRNTNGDAEKWNVAPEQITFNEIQRTSKNSVIFGGNYFDLPPTRCWLIWDKKQPVKQFARCELAWTNFEKNSEIFEYNYFGAINSNDGRFHPTEKPIELYKWLCDNYTKPTDTILDCFGGSMSNAIACHMKRRKLTIIELDKYYFDMALLRFSEYEQKVEDIKEFGYAKTKINAQNPVLF